MKEELKKLGFTPNVITTVEKYLSFKGENSKILTELQSLVGTGSDFQKGFDRLSGIVNMLKKSGSVKEGSFKIDPSIARGLDYYTGLIFETTFVDDPGFGSICSGGRYDNLIKLPSGEFIPAIGISIGLDRLFAAMESKSLLPKVKTTTKVFIANFGEDFLPEYLQIASNLRDNGISVEVFPRKIKLARQLKIVNNKGIPIVLIIGSDELSSGRVAVKNMEDGSQESVTRDRLAAYLGGVL